MYYLGTVKCFAFVLYLFFLFLPLQAEGFWCYCRHGERGLFQGILRSLCASFLVGVLTHSVLFQILKEGSEGPVVVSIELRQLKSASFDKKFHALDHRMKTISVNDTVRILQGPLQV